MKFILQNYEHEVLEDVVPKLRDKHLCPRTIRPRKARYYSSRHYRLLPRALRHHWHSSLDYSKEETQAQARWFRQTSLRPSPDSYRIWRRAGPRQRRVHQPFLCSSMSKHLRSSTKYYVTRNLFPCRNGSRDSEARINSVSVSHFRETICGRRFDRKAGSFNDLHLVRLLAAWHRKDYTLHMAVSGALS